MQPWPFVLTLVLVIAACAPPPSPSVPLAAPVTAPAGPKRITVAIVGEAHTLYSGAAKTWNSHEWDTR